MSEPFTTVMASMKLPGGTIAHVTEVKSSSQVARRSNFAVWFSDGVHDDGEEVKTFPTVREAFCYLATVTEALQAEVQS